MNGRKVGKMRMVLRQAGLVLAVCVAGEVAAGAAEVPGQPCDPAALPQYEDFAVSLQTPAVPPVLKTDNRFARKYRTRLIEGLRDNSVNFAGHYVMITWGCGTTCLDGGMVDAQTGRAIALPFPLDIFGSFEVDIADPLLYRADSRLVVMLGMLREDDEMPRRYFYEWAGGKFMPICHAPISTETR